MVILINPNLVVLRSDLFTTGIVYMPIGLAYFAAALRSRAIPCEVVDAFGERPLQCWSEEDFLIRGLKPAEVAARMPAGAKAIVLYAINLTYHRALIGIIRAIRERDAAVPIVILENTQAVTAYSLRRVQEEFYAEGVNYVITGEAEERGVRLIRGLLDGTPAAEVGAIEGIGSRNADGQTRYSPPVTKVADLDELPFPAWDLFPLNNYWKLKYAHGPFETDRYLPLLTSRGCPYPCRFCVIPETNDLRWRARSAGNVVDEIEQAVERYGVREFHIEDVDPTVNDNRTRDFCHELLKRKLNVIWKLCSGTKVETMRDEATVELMARAGCRYISISPESGSPRVLKSINKPFRIDHAVKLVKAMNRVGIRCQACFVLGFPGENDEDRRLTWDLVRDLTKVGVDEVVMFIITPVPGSAIYDQFHGFSDYSQLNFSPTWREDYRKLNEFRMRLYRAFLGWKLRYHPLKMARQPLNFIARRFETKMEMTPYRALRTRMLRVES